MIEEPMFKCPIDGITFTEEEEEELIKHLKEVHGIEV